MEKSKWVSNLDDISRRTLVKSVGLALGGSALASAMPAMALSTAGPMAGSQSSNANPSMQNPMHPTNNAALTPPIRQRMVSFMLAHEQFPVPELVRLGVAAERAGFDMVATSDHLQPWQANEGHAGQAWVTLSSLGARTQKIWIGTTVTCPSFRYNPAVVAEAFASLCLLYPGRIFLGVGSGEAINEEAATGVWPTWSERSERLVEATGAIRALWSGEQVNHRSKYFEINAKLYDPPPVYLPLLMAANVGPNAMFRSGKYGDGLITDPETWRKHRDAFAAGARSVGKDPHQMPILAEQFVVVGGKQEAQTAAQLWHFIPRAFKTYFNVVSPQVIEEEADAQLPLEKVYSQWPVSTNPDVHVRTIIDLFESGVTVVNIHSGQPDQMHVIEFYGEHVLPRLHQYLHETSA